MRNRLKELEKDSCEQIIKCFMQKFSSLVENLVIEHRHNTQLDPIVCTFFRDGKEIKFKCQDWPDLFDFLSDETEPPKK